MIDILFNPNGRITSGQFVKGAIVLIVIGALMALLPLFAPMAIAKYASWLMWLLIYPWICLFMKRFRDGGKPGAMCLIPFGIYAVLSMIVGGVMMFSNPAMQEIMQAAAEGADAADIEAMSLEIGQSMAGMSAAVGAVISAVIAFGTNALIKHDPNDNKYGPAN